MHRGFVKTYRRLAESPLWLEEKFTRGQAWMDLILLANYKDNYIRVRGIKLDVKRGQCGWSVLRLSERWGWSRGKTQRFLDELETVQQIAQQKNRLTSLITIINYDRYQGNGTTDGTTDGQQTDNRRTLTIKEKKEKKEKNIKGVKKSCQIPTDFCLTDPMKKYATNKGIDKNQVDDIFEHFKDHHIAKGTTFKDWNAGWRTWCQNHVKFNKRNEIPFGWTQAEWEKRVALDKTMGLR